MKIMWKLLAVTVMAVGLMGCNEESKPAAAGTEAVTKKVEATAPAAPAAPVATPATAKPKDHPAH